MDKGTKLETIFDRIHMVDTRFEVLRRDAEIEALKRQLSDNGLEPVNLDDDMVYQKRLKWIEESRKFVAKCNVGGETISDEVIKRIEYK